MNDKNRPDLGSKLKEIRTARNLSLTEVSQMSGIARSTLYKVENSGVSLTYGKLIDLAQGLQIDVTELFHPSPSAAAPRRIATRREVTNVEEGDVVETDNYKYVYLCNSLRNKRMIPTTIYLKTKTLEEFGNLVDHPGEEFSIVLSGSAKVVTEYYEDVTLKKGDVLYMDSSMPHAYLKASDEDAVVLTLCSIDPRDIDALAEEKREKTSVKSKKTKKAKKTKKKSLDA